MEKTIRSGKELGIVFVVFAVGILIAIIFG